jgi:hypothetical protein
MRHLIGYIIICLSVVLTSGMLLWKRYSWNKRLPQDYHRGVGMRYLPDSVRPWANWKECIDVVIDVLACHQTFGKNLGKLIDFWVEVVPYHKALTNSSVVTGWVQETNGTFRTANRPTNEEEAKDRKRVVGSVKIERCFPWSKPQHIIQLVQTKDEDNEIDGRLMRGTGMIVSMDRSAFFYEVAKRHIEFVFTKNYYDLVTVEPHYAELESMFVNAYKTRNG